MYMFICVYIYIYIQIHIHIYIYIYIYIVVVLLHALWSRVRGEEFGAIMQEKQGGRLRSETPEAPRGCDSTRWVL